MKLLIKQRIFSWTDTYDVFDENQTPRYYVKAEFFTLGHQIHVYDKQTGNEVGAIHQRLLSMLPKFDIEINGRTMGTVNKQFTFFKPKYELDYLGLRVEGNLLGWDYDVMNGCSKVMHISKEPLNWGDTYVIDYQNREEELTGLLLVLAIDASNCGDNN